MKKAKRFLKYPLGMFFIAAGVGHFVMAEFFLAIMPPYIPWHHFFVYLSGVAEIALGVGLLIPKTTRLAAWGLIALLIAVFPANIHMALNADDFAEFGTPLGLWVRLPMQGVLIAWAFWYTRPAVPGQ